MNMLVLRRCFFGAATIMMCAASTHNAAAQHGGRHGTHSVHAPQAHVGHRGVRAPHMSRGHHAGAVARHGNNHSHTINTAVIEHQKALHEKVLRITAEVRQLRRVAGVANRRLSILGERLEAVARDGATATELRSLRHAASSARQGIAHLRQEVGAFYSKHKARLPDAAKSRLTAAIAELRRQEIHLRRGEKALYSSWVYPGPCSYKCGAAIDALSEFMGANAGTIMSGIASEKATIQAIINSANFD